MFVFELEFEFVSSSSFLRLPFESQIGSREFTSDAGAR